jgi:hypothetical protein
MNFQLRFGPGLRSDFRDLPVGHVGETGEGERTIVGLVNAGQGNEGHLFLRVDCLTARFLSSSDLPIKTAFRTWKQIRFRFRFLRFHRANPICIFGNETRTASNPGILSP